MAQPELKVIADLYDFMPAWLGGGFFDAGGERDAGDYVGDARLQRPEVDVATPDVRRCRAARLDGRVHGWTYYHE